jgi:hypothetical protein
MLRRFAWAVGFSRHRLLLHLQLRTQVVEVAEDRGDGQEAAGALEAEEAVVGGDVALDGELIPALGVAGDDRVGVRGVPRSSIG